MYNYVYPRMTTQVITENSIHETVLTTINTPPTPKDNKYRYYICHTNWANDLECRQVSSPSAESKENNTRLLFVNKFIPEIFDPILLKKRFMPTRVIIK
jgi:hypothetical protein